MKKMILEIKIAYFKVIGIISDIEGHCYKYFSDKPIEEIDILVYF